MLVVSETTSVTFPVIVEPEIVEAVTGSPLMEVAIVLVLVSVSDIVLVDTDVFVPLSVVTAVECKIVVDKSMPDVSDVLLDVVFISGVKVAFVVSDNKVVDTPEVPFVEFPPHFSLSFSG